MKHKAIIFSFFAVLLISCHSIKPKGANRSGKKLFENFYLGEKGTQYFIKPLEFENDSEVLFIDFTVREKEKMVSLNFSIVAVSLIKEITLFSIQNSSVKANLVNYKKLYSERKKELFESRFSAEVSIEELKELFNEANWEINVNQFAPFKASKPTQKSIIQLKDHIFSLF